MFRLTPQEIAFLNKYKSHDELSAISYLINALVIGSELSHNDLLIIEDHIMDRTNEMDDSDVPDFFDGIRSIISRLFHSKPATATQPVTTTAPEQVSEVGNNEVASVKVEAPKKTRVKKEPTVKTSKLEKYKESEITADNIPQYLLDIQSIVNKVVEARCQEEIQRRISAEEKLGKLQKILGSFS